MENVFKHELEQVERQQKTDQTIRELTESTENMNYKFKGFGLESIKFYYPQFNKPNLDWVIILI